MTYDMLDLEIELENTLKDFKQEFREVISGNPYIHYLNVTLKYEEILWSIAGKAVCFDEYHQVVKACGNVQNAIDKMHSVLKEHL